jgi:uncharacterized RDD family membrane protein YckC
MDWHYVALGKAVGPIPEEELTRLAAAGQITRDTLLWHAGMAEWKEAKLVKPDLWPPMAPPAPPATPAAAPPAPGAVPGPLPLAVRYGGFWIRFVARLIDWLILIFVGSAVNLVTGIGAIGLGGLSILHNGDFDPAELVHLIAAGFAAAMVKILLSAIYEIAFLTRFGATPGKMALGLKILKADGTRISFARATGRYFAYWLTCLTAPLLWVGFWIAGIDREKRALHDFICDTRVVRT